MQQKNKNQNDTVITLSDLVHIFNTHKMAIIFGALICCLLAGAFSLSRTVLYNVEGTFKDKGKSNAGMGGLSMLLGGGSNQIEGEAMATIKSRKFMEKLIYRRGLQGQLTKLEPRFDLFGSIPDNIKVEYANFMGLQKPILKDNPPIIWLQDVAYNDEISKGFTVRFLDNDTFQIEYNGAIVGTSEIGKRFHGDDYSFTIFRKTTDSLAKTTWSLQLHPIKYVSDNLLGLTTVEADRYDKNLLHIRLLYPDRHVGAEILNSMMLIYQEHIRQEQKRISKEQIAYLETRQKEMAEKLRKMMESHAATMSNDMVNTGFLNSLKAIEFFSANQAMHQQKLHEIELAIKRLHKAQEESDYAHHEGFGDAGIINHSLAEIRNLKQQSDILDLALKNAFADKENPFHATFEKQLVSLELVRQSQIEACLLKDCLKTSGQYPKIDTLLNDPNLAVKVWHKKLIDDQNQLSDAKTDDDKKKIENQIVVNKESFAAYVTNLIHLFGVQEKVIKERLALQQSPQKEFEGIDLNTSRELYINYNRILNEVQTNVRQLDFMIEQLKNPDFEVTSMSSIPNDFVTNEMVSKASQIVQSIKDQNNRSSNEITRLKEQLTVQKEFLVQHLNQTVLLQKLKEQLVKEKILSLQSVTLGLLRQQISILDKHMQDYVGKRLKDLSQESDLIVSHQKVLREEMKDLPNKWVEERLIDQQMAINQKMVQDVAGLVESKNLETNLEILQSYPQDFALPPLQAKSTRSIIYAFFGAFAGAFITFTFFIVKSALYGVRASVDNLKANHLHVSGLISPKAASKDGELLDKDLDTLRRLIAYFTSGPPKKDGQSLLLLNGAGVDYSPHLAELFSKMGLNVLFMPIVFKDMEKGHGQGLIQFLEGTIPVPVVVHERKYDCIYEGGVSRYAVELIGSNKFKELLVALKAEYDWIVVVSDVMPASGQADALVEIFDHTAVNLTHENISDLKAYMRYKIDPSTDHKKVSFLFSTINL